MAKLERKPLQCGHCGEMLKGKFNLMRHIKRKHANASQNHWKKNILNKFLEN